MLCLTFGVARGGDGGPVRVRVVTSSGPFTVEVYPDEAPATVARFLAEAPAQSGRILCESRAHGFFVFGCTADPVPPGMEPEPPPGTPIPDEVDAEAMGLAARTIDGNPERNRLWQLEIVPRYRALRESGRPVPDGLQSLIDAVRSRGTAAFTLLDAMSREAYLEAIGYRFTPGASSRRVLRGAVATASFWPGEAGARFLVALTDLPERDGRATVFGRVVDGWDALDAIARIPVDDEHVPRTKVALVRMEMVR